MNQKNRTAIVTGASQGIGAGIVKAFVERGFNVVATSRRISESAEVAASDRIARVDGHIGEPATAAKVVETSSRSAMNPGQGSRRVSSRTFGLAGHRQAS